MGAPEKAVGLAHAQPCSSQAAGSHEAIWASGCSRIKGIPFAGTGGSAPSWPTCSGLISLGSPTRSPCSGQIKHLGVPAREHGATSRLCAFIHTVPSTWDTCNLALPG